MTSWCNPAVFHYLRRRGPDGVGSEHFFTTDHCQELCSSVPIGDGWIAVTDHIPTYVPPCQACPNGIANTLEDYIGSVLCGSTELANPDPSFKPGYVT